MLYLSAERGVKIMDKTDLAYKLTADTLKKYDLSVLEEKYNAVGGKLISKIFNEIHQTIEAGDGVVYIKEDLASQD